ncbi:MAG: hypothetical protein ACOX87_01790 [Chloroflexota bacterium]
MAFQYDAGSLHRRMAAPPLQPSIDGVTGQAVWHIYGNPQPIQRLPRY